MHEQFTKNELLKTDVKDSANVASTFEGKTNVQRMDKSMLEIFQCKLVLTIFDVKQGTQFAESFCFDLLAKT